MESEESEAIELIDGPDADAGQTVFRHQTQPGGERADILKPYLPPRSCGVGIGEMRRLGGIVELYFRENGRGQIRGGGIGNYSRCEALLPRHGPAVSVV